ncbi:MAG: branched-chain amino acid aminotransferase [Oscillospiraceae bacterium]|nr:branched-chain amino acid aminotransferase [Oscillospiraceae bacterium]
MFSYSKAPYRYIAKYKNGKWEEGYLSQDANVVLNESACVLQYAQCVFEGLKAYKTRDGRIVCFRPDCNASRMKDSAIRMAMPPYPEDKYLEAIDMVVRANREVIPPYGDGSSLYLRPFMIGTTPVLGVKPADEYEFRIFASPVGPYFDGKIKLRVCDFDRAAPNGTGNIKASLNYAMSLYAIADAHAQGYDENLYLDAATRRFLEETGGANIFFVTKEGSLVTPASGTILPSITRRSVLEVASKVFGMPVEERRISIDEIGGFEECGLCGTAAVISPVESIDDHGQIYRYFRERDFESSFSWKLRTYLTEVQRGERVGPEGWMSQPLSNEFESLCLPSGVCD